MGEVNASDTCGAVRFPQLYSSPYCQRGAGHSKNHHGFGQDWNDDEPACSLGEVEVFVAARDRIGDWEGASHLQLALDDNGVAVVNVPAPLYNALMGIDGDIDVRVLMPIDGFNALAESAADRIKRIRREVNERIKASA